MTISSDLVGRTSQEVVEQAETDIGGQITTLSSLIEKHARELIRLKGEIKQRRESLKSVFENDSQYQEAKEEVDKHSETLKERKAQIVNDPQAISLKTDIAELNQEKKEIEETLSNHLINYHGLTNSTSFDTSDGDQWDFKIKASIKPKQLKLFE